MCSEEAVSRAVPYNSLKREAGLLERTAHIFVLGNAHEQAVQHNGYSRSQRKIALAPQPCALGSDHAVSCSYARNVLT
jgi:hypothetical protein